MKRFLRENWNVIPVCYIYVYLCIFICCYMYLHTGVNSIKVYVEIPESSVNYLFDGASLQQINKNLNWKAEANKRIEQIRKAPLNIR